MQGMFRANGGCGYVKKPDLLQKVRPDGKVFDPKANLPVKTTLKVSEAVRPKVCSLFSCFVLHSLPNLTRCSCDVSKQVKVYMGEGWHMDFHHTHFDMYSPPDFYTRVRSSQSFPTKIKFIAAEFASLQVGIAGVPADSGMQKTKALEDDWTPAWNEEFEFPLTVPELAMLRIEVHEYDMSEKDDFGGQTCIPVTELRTGIRAVPLHDQKGEKYNNVKLLMRFQFV